MYDYSTVYLKLKKALKVSSIAKVARKIARVARLLTGRESGENQSLWIPLRNLYLTKFCFSLAFQILSSMLGLLMINIIIYIYNFNSLYHYCRGVYHAKIFTLHARFFCFGLLGLYLFSMHSYWEFVVWVLLDICLSHNWVSFDSGNS